MMRNQKARTMEAADRFGASAGPWLRRQLGAARTLALYDQMLVSGVNFVTLVTLGRVLTAEQFGWFTLAYLACFGLSSLHNALIVQPFNLIGATRARELNVGHLHALLRVHGLMWLPASLVILALVSWQFFPDPALFAASSFYLCAFLLQELLRRYWYVAGEIGRALTNDAISYGLQLPVLLLWAAQPGFDAVSGFYVMGSTSVLALAHGWLSLRMHRATFISARATFESHWRVGGIWMLLGVVSAYGALQLYPYMLASLGAGAVAAYAAARNLLNALNVLAQATHNYLPITSTRILEREGAARLGAYLWRVGIGMFVAAGIFCALIGYGSQELLRLVYGKSFEGTGAALPLLSLLGVAFVLFPVVYTGIIVLQRTHVVFISNMIATVFNLSVGWWLIRRFGVEGAAIAASLSAVLVLVIQAWRLKRALVSAATPLQSKPCMP